MSSYKVELKPHKGMMRSIFGPIEVEHDQWMIYVNGLHVGYVGKSPAAPINIFQEMTKSMLQDVRSEISKLLGGVSVVVQPPTDAEVAEHLRVVAGDVSEEEDDEG